MSQAFYDISLEMQSAGIPLISNVIPCIDDLVRVIDDFKDDASKHPAVRSAAIRGLTILNKYYQKSDESFVYCIAMGMSCSPLTQLDNADLNLMKLWILGTNYSTLSTKPGLPTGSIQSRISRARSTMRIIMVLFPLIFRCHQRSLEHQVVTGHHSCRQHHRKNPCIKSVTSWRSSGHHLASLRRLIQFSTG